jgi:hypothetical protein
MSPARDIAYYQERDTTSRTGDVAGKEEVSHQKN